MFKKNIVLTNLSHTFLTGFPLEVKSADQVLFFDIETTGLGWKRSVVYLIGAVHYKNSRWTLTQWFAETEEEEKEILMEFYLLADRKSYFIHYNGTSFDVPYLKQKYNFYQLSHPFTDKKQLDLYQKFIPLKKLFKLENMRQKDLESLLSYPRKDTFSGKELIQKYKEYLKNPTPELLELILLHNYDDLMGMIGLRPLFSFFQLLNGSWTIRKASIISTETYEGTEEPELLITLDLLVPLPFPFSFSKADYYLTGKDRQARIKSPVKDGTLKLYFPNYQDYYYLPLEDTAIHKSIGCYVDKEHRIKATPELCYQKFECTEEFLENPKKLLRYVRGVLGVLEM